MAGRRMLAWIQQFGGCGTPALVVIGPCGNIPREAARLASTELPLQKYLRSCMCAAYVCVP